jgi:hypothetical protein
MHALRANKQTTTNELMMEDRDQPKDQARGDLISPSSTVMAERGGKAKGLLLSPTFQGKHLWPNLRRKP